MSKILLTGLPGVGKTTLIQRVVEKLDGPVRGFYTQEIRDKGTRVGFSLSVLGGQTLVLSHVNIRGPYRVGKYGVDVKGFEETVCEEIERGLAEKALLVIDEIGKMELFSERFQRTVLTAFDSASPMLAAILQRSHPFTDAIKRRPDVELIEVTRTNRNHLVGHVWEKLKSTVP